MEYRHTLFYCTLLYCVSCILHFYKLKVCGNPVLSKSISTIFPKAFAYFLFPCHILVILAKFLVILIFVMVICDPYCNYYMFWDIMSHGCVRWIVYDATAPATSCSSSLSLSSGSPIPWGTTILKLGQLIILQWLLSVQVKGRAASFLLLIKS